MTRQVADIVIYDNREYLISGIIGKGLLTPIDLGLTPCTMSTACYRGYICSYKFVDDKLYLTEMLVRTADEQFPVINGVSAMPFYGASQYQDLKVFCNLSGGLVLVRDELRIPAVVPNPSCFGTVIEIILINGQIEQAIDHSETMHDIRRRMDEVPDSHSHWRIKMEIEWSFVSGYKEQPVIC